MVNDTFFLACQKSVSGLGVKSFMLGKTTMSDRIRGQGECGVGNPNLRDSKWTKPRLILRDESSSFAVYELCYVKVLSIVRNAQWIILK